MWDLSVLNKSVKYLKPDMRFKSEWDSHYLPKLSVKFPSEKFIV